MKRGREYTVYREFLTNLAVGWFSAGIIVPLLTPEVRFAQLYGFVIAFIACGISLRLAVFFSKITS